MTWSNSIKRSNDDNLQQVQATAGLLFLVVGLSLVSCRFLWEFVIASLKAMSWVNDKYGEKLRIYC